MKDNTLYFTYIVRGYSPEVSKGLEDLERAVTLVITNNYVEAEAILKGKWVWLISHDAPHVCLYFT